MRAAIRAWMRGAALALVAVAPPMQATPAPDFELPTTDGRGFVRLLAPPAAPTLVAFWSVDCPHCLLEMETLRDFARQHPQWRVLTVNTDPPQRLRLQAAAVEPPGTGLRVAGNPRALLRRYGNADGALPFAIAVDSEGRLCSRARGELTARALGAITRSCQPAR